MRAVGREMAYLRARGDKKWRRRGKKVENLLSGGGGEAFEKKSPLHFKEVGLLGGKGGRKGRLSIKGGREKGASY